VRLHYQGGKENIMLNPCIDRPDRVMLWSIAPCLASADGTQHDDYQAHRTMTAASKEYDWHMTAIYTRWVAARGGQIRGSGGIGRDANTYQAIMLGRARSNQGIHGTIKLGCGGHAAT
jgi:hypothetical protein